MSTRSFRAALLATCFLSLTVHFSFATEGNVLLQKKKWVDSVFNSLSIEEKIGQLFMVAAYSGGPDFNDIQITRLIQNHQIGGLIFMQGDPVSQAFYTNKYQQMAQVRLLLAMDAEWGLGMRLKGVKDFPRNMMIGAAHDTVLAYQVGAAIAAQCKRIGVHIDFAPVVDVNNNPENPVINARSFGEDKFWVTRLGIAYMRGLQKNGVMACGKHFPGHGDTDVDSHEELPSIKKTIQQLNELELYPFTKLMEAGLKSMMIAHLDVPALGTAPHTPATLSKTVVTGLLREKMVFKGLIFTDALNMKGIAKYYPPGEIDLKALIAGNDMLLFSQDVPVAIEKIKSAIDSGLISMSEMEGHVRRILNAKFDVGLANFTPVSDINITADLNKETEPLRDAITRKAATVVKDKNKLLSKMLASDARVYYIGVNASESLLYRRLQDSLKDMSFSWLPKGSSAADAYKIKQGMEDMDVNIVVIHNSSFYPLSGGNYSLDAQQVKFLTDLQTKKNVLYVLMGNAYLTKRFCGAGSVLVAYEDDSISESVVSEILLRKFSPGGKLPVTTCILPEPVVFEKTLTDTPPKTISVNDLVKTDFVQDAGVKNPEALDNLDMFIQKSIVGGAFPGCRLLAAKDGKVFYDKAFGYFDYSKKQAVDSNTIYDVASLTKVLSTTLAVMRLYEEGKLNLDKTLGDYLKWTKGTDKAGLKIRNLLLHQAGLKSWIPFYKETLDEAGELRTNIYSHESKNNFNIPVAKDLYMRSDYADTVWSRILTSPLENKGKFVYSDLDYYFLAAVVEEITNTPLNKYVEEQFYNPLGLNRIGYLPLKKFLLTEIAPTEQDISFRKELVHGYVHDPGAAMLGGVAGHAGVFASAGDVAVIFQLLLNKGMYGGKRYFKKETVEYFTKYNSSISRRGLGFDKPAADKNDAGPAGNSVSGFAFGHQGFTGTCAWADPETGILFVFLSNRVYPSADNSNINRLSVRTKAQDYIYEAFGILDNHSRVEVWKGQVK